MELDKIKIGNRFRKELGDIEGLVQSIKEVGLLQPIVIDEKNNLIAGLRRLTAFKELGYKDIPVNIVNIKNTLQGQYDENTARKNFAPSEDVAIWRALESYQEQRSRSVVERIEKPESKIKKAAKITGRSTDTLSKARQVVEYGDKDLIETMDRTNNVKKVYRQVKQKKDEKKIIQQQPQLEAKGKFKTILIDPPWDYEGLNLASRGIPEYAVKSLDDLREMDIQKNADENSHLYLWATNNYLYEALKLGEHWGFQYKTLITWVKPSIGLGSYFRNSTEQCLFFVKGKLTTRVKNIPTHFNANRGKHSEKPEESYQLIEKASYPPYLEIFGRRLRPNWTVRGNLE